MQVQLKNNKNIITAYAIVDTKFFAQVNKYKWYLTKDSYAQSCINNEFMTMHQFVMGKIKKLSIT